jgi:hypothetical protein
VTFVRLASSSWLFAVLAVASIVSAASCGYDDRSYQGVGFACDALHACPDGSTCVNARCVSGNLGDDPAPPSELGVNCGGVSCSPSTVCCNDFTIPLLTCLPAGACTLASGRNPVTCDGPEDCGANGACCTDGIGGATCATSRSCDADDKICHTNIDCPVSEPFCCPSDSPARPFKVCDSSC